MTLRYLLFFTLTLTVTVLVMFIAASIGTFFVKIYNTIDHTRIRRKLSICGYQCYYLDNRSMEQDADCMQLLPILSELYTKGSRFNAFCTRLSKERMPWNVIMNWSRSIAEDLFSAAIPSVKLDQWNHYWKSKVYTRMAFFHSDFPEYDENELGCLWGMVYMWLAVYFEKDVNDDLLKRIVQVACKEKPAVPYFYHFYNSVREMLGEGMYLACSPQGSDKINGVNSMLYDNGNSISADSVYNGFEALSTAERCKARQIFNDVLADSLAWKQMRQEMKRRGWFKEKVYPIGGANISVSGDFISGDKVAEKTVLHDVSNFKPQIETQSIEMPMQAMKHLVDN